MIEGGSKPEDRLALGLRLAAGRRPDEGEMRVLLDEPADSADVLPEPSEGSGAVAGSGCKALLTRR